MAHYKDRPKNSKRHGPRVLQGRQYGLMAGPGIPLRRGYKLGVDLAFSSEELNERIRCLCAKAVSTSPSPELDEILLQLRATASIMSERDGPGALL